MVKALRVFQKAADENSPGGWGFTISGCEKQVGGLVPSKPETHHRFGDGFPAERMQDSALGQLALQVAYERGFIRVGDQPDSIDIDRRVGGRGNHVIPSEGGAPATVEPPTEGVSVAPVDVPVEPVAPADAPVEPVELPKSTPADGTPLGTSDEPLPPPPAAVQPEPEAAAPKARTRK